MASPVPFKELKVKEKYRFSTKGIPDEKVVTIHSVKFFGNGETVQSIEQSSGPLAITELINPSKFKHTYTPYSKGGKRQSRRRHRKRQTRRKSH